MSDANLAELLEQLKAYTPESQVTGQIDLPVADFKAHNDNVTALQSAIDLHQPEVDLVNQLYHAITELKVQLADRRRVELLSLEQAKLNAQKAKRLEAEKLLEDGFKPDLSNPELQNLIQVLEKWEHYHNLDDYQIEDVVFMFDRWLRTKDQTPSPTNAFTRGVINANDTGMGKTVETIAFLWAMRQLNPKCHIIWFTKTSLVKETTPEANEKWNFPMVPVVGTTPEKLNLIRTMRSFSSVQPLCLTMNYECVNQKDIMKELNDECWDFLVIDEVHKLRGGANYTPTQMWQNTLKFRQTSNAWPLMLSGSIINNKPKELWAFLHIMDDERYPSVADFEVTINYGALDPKKLLKVLAPSMFRRRKDEVNIKMPERVIRHHHLEMEDPTLKQVYNEFAATLITWLENEERSGRKVLSAKSILDQLIRLRGLCVAPGSINVKKRFINPNSGEQYELIRNTRSDDGKWYDPITGDKYEKNYDTLLTGKPDKLDYVVEFANELIMEGEQVVIASSGFKAPLDYIADKLIGKCEKLYGPNTSIGGDIAHRFRQGETRVILTNLQSGAEGFNLHKDPDSWPGGAEHLIMIDDWYNPEIVRQMWDRVWRRGSKNRVIIHVIQFENSVDQFVEAIREEKAMANGKITEHTSLRATEWIDLLKKALGR